MKIEKKLILCSILALAIGVATVVPVEYLMLAEAQTTDDLTHINPWFNVDVSYAYCNPELNNVGNSTTQLYGASIQAVANFSLTPEALKDADAQIEYYKFAVSSDQGPIVDMGYYVYIEKPGITNGMAGNGTIWFTNGFVYNGPASNGGQGLNFDFVDRNYTTGFVSDYIYGTNANDVPQAVLDIRSAQKLYIDVSKVCTVTVKGSTAIATQADGTILQHIELTKTADGLIYGNYVQGTLPLPIDVPSTSPAPPPTIFATFGPANITNP